MAGAELWKLNVWQTAFPPEVRRFAQELAAEEEGLIQERGSMSRYQRLTRRSPLVRRVPLSVC